ncbi:MAG: hypothetical protein RL648_1334 [Verrucomicrobiota bacterium]|jgi:hypothetical protein
MIPSLFMYSMLAGAFLLMAGLPFLFVPARVEGPLRAFPRHRLTGILTMLVGGGWFIWKILQLGPADFGDYKEWMALLFAVTVVAAIFHVPDFLAVRGVAILALLTANVGLKSAYALYDIPGRLLLVTVLYVIIIAGIIYGIMPYLMRGTVRFISAEPSRLRAMGAGLCVTGMALLVTAFTY